MASLETLKSNFDLRGYLEDKLIPYATDGKNISAGWLGIQCPFPDCGDPSNHLGIHLTKKFYSCWICGASGDIISLIQEIEQVSFTTAKMRVEEFQEMGESRHSPFFVTKGKSEYDSLLPTRFKPLVRGAEPLLVRSYFKRRNFALDICQKYGLGYVDGGEYQMRLIAPVYSRGRLVSFQAVDMTGKANVPYVDCPEDRALVHNKHLVYGIDHVAGEQLILVEGLTDKWRMGDDSSALFGKNYTSQQLLVISDKIAEGRIKVVKVLLDPDATKQAEDLTMRIAQRFVAVRVKCINLECGDPADLSPEEAQRVRDL
jgi:hypothetical protein